MHDISRPKTHAGILQNVRHAYNNNNNNNKIIIARRPNAPCSNPGMGKRLFSLQHVQTCSGAHSHPVQCLRRVLSQVVKRPGRETHHSSRTSAEVSGSSYTCPLHAVTGWRSTTAQLCPHLGFITRPTAAPTAATAADTTTTNNNNNSLLLLLLLLLLLIAWNCQVC